MALEQIPDSHLPGDDSLGVVHARLDLHRLSARQVNLGLEHVLQCIATVEVPATRRLFNGFTTRSQLILIEIVGSKAPRGPRTTDLEEPEIAVAPVPPLLKFAVLPTPAPIAPANNAPGTGTEGTPRAA